MRYSSDISKLNKHPLNRVCYGHLRQLDHVDSISEGEQYYQQYMLCALAEDGIPKEYLNSLQALSPQVVQRPCC